MILIDYSDKVIRYSSKITINESNYQQAVGQFHISINGGDPVATSIFDKITSINYDGVASGNGVIYNITTGQLGPFNTWQLVSTEKYENNENKYTNGTSDRYWYTSVSSFESMLVPILSSHTTYSKGTYIDTVESDNENAYPINGRSGDYWYVKIT